MNFSAEQQTKWSWTVRSDKWIKTAQRLIFGQINKNMQFHLTELANIPSTFHRIKESIEAILYEASDVFLKYL